jgi:hypothetical protein
MVIRIKLAEKIEKKREEIAALEKLLGEAKSYLLALQDTMKMMPKTEDAEAAALSLRPGTDVAKAYETLKSAGKPLHVNDIVKRIGKEATKQNRVSMSGSLGGYARRNYIFTRPAPNTFGLVELESSNPSEEPPEDFGATAEAAGSITQV